MDEKDRLQQLYPELADGTTIRELFNAALLQIGSGLVDADESRRFFASSYARFAVRPRSSQIFIAAEKREFIADYWDHGVHLANGPCSDLMAVSYSVDQWVSGRASIRSLAQAHPFVKLLDGALEHEDGTRTAYMWRYHVQHGASMHPDIPLLAQVAALNSKLGVLFPYISIGTLCLSRCTGYPFTNGAPSFLALGQQRFRVTGLNGERLGEGSAEVVVELAAAAIPDDWGPARKGTADDGNEA